MNTPQNNDMENRIISAAKSVFIEKGFAETNMGDIAAKAGINRPALHYYFRTKEKMFQAVFGEIISTIIPKVFGLLVQKDKPIDKRFEEIVNAYYCLFLENPRLPMFVIREMNRDISLLIRTATSMSMPQNLQSVINSLQEEMDEGKLKKVPLRFLFYNFYGLLTTPFLTLDITESLFLEKGETFKEMLEKWKPYIISQMKYLLAVET